MEIYHQKDNLQVFGLQVKTFPEGIDRAFDSLVKKVGGFNRAFYGISEMGKNGMIYRAAALETYKGEAQKLNYERYTIEKGDYLTIRIEDWRNKLDLIRHAFDLLSRQHGVAQDKPIVEWYKNDHEMLCMVRTEETRTNDN
jgi:hypothetical protein